MYLYRPHNLIIHLKVCQMCYEANPLYSLSSEIKLHLNGHETALLIPFKKD